jgi:transposase
LQRLLRQALRLWQQQQRGEAPEFTRRREGLQRALTHVLRDRELEDPDNARLLNQLGWHHDRGNLLRFLFEPGVEPTNNRAERALRPAVIARKVSQCSKNERGAAVRSAFTSVVRTLTQRHVGDVVSALAQVFGTGTVPAAPP